jgi:hypothetical protein
VSAKPTTSSFLLQCAVLANATAKGRKKGTFHSPSKPFDFQDTSSGHISAQRPFTVDESDAIAPSIIRVVGTPEPFGNFTINQVYGKFNISPPLTRMASCAE